MSLRPVSLPDADLAFDPGFLMPDEAAALFEALRCGIAWEIHRIRIFGREVESPRLSCWIGDPGTAYVYSRTRFDPKPWLPALSALRDRIERAADSRFNCVLANLYRDGRDGMGWHSDDEPELGPRPVIASLSLGHKRRFSLRHRREGGGRLDLDLPAGSLLLMRGATQAHYRHCLPKTARAVGERINLTYRCIPP